MLGTTPSKPPLK